MRNELCVLCFAMVLAMPVRVHSVDGVLRIYPVGQQTSVAVGIPLEEGQALSGVQWYHNDESTPFSSLTILEGDADGTPNMQEAALVLAQVTGESLAWGGISLDTPVTSGTDFIFAVFTYPPNQEMTDAGIGGGPGIGIEVGVPGEYFVSPEGQTWIRSIGGDALAVVGTTVVAKSHGSVPLSSLKGSGPVEYTRVEPRLIGEKLKTHLVGASPNPFNPRTEISFELRSRSEVRVAVYDVRGRLIRTLAEARFESGRHTLAWEGVDGRAKAVASGVYFVRMDAGGQTWRTRISLVR